MALTAARATRVIVIISSAWLSCAVREPGSPNSSRSLSRAAWAPRAATIPLTVTKMLAMLSTTRRGLRAATRSPRSSGAGSRAEIAMIHAVRRGGRAASARARTVLVRAARTAGTRVAATTTARATAVTCPTVDMVSWRRTGAAEETYARVGEQGRGQSTGRQPGRCRGEGDGDVLGEEHCGGQARCAADRLEQSDAAVLVGHPAADEDGDAGQGEHADQPAADHQDLPLVPDQLGGLVADVLPGHPPSPTVRNGRVAAVSGDERRGGGGVGQLEVRDVAEHLLGCDVRAVGGWGQRRGETQYVGLGEPDHAGAFVAGDCEAVDLRVRRRCGGDGDTRNHERASVEGELIAFADPEGVGEGGLDDHAAVRRSSGLR